MLAQRKCTGTTPEKKYERVIDLSPGQESPLGVPRSIMPPPAPHLGHSYPIMVAAEVSHPIR